MRLNLECHRLATVKPVDSVAVDYAWIGQGCIELRYDICGDVDKLKWPAPGAPKREDQLWQTTCLELFVKTGTAAEYLEYNFSPSSCWAFYSFKDYRSGQQSPELSSAPQIAILEKDGKVTLTAIAWLPDQWSSIDPTELSLGLSAILEDGDGAKTFWALDHPPGKPDFHHSICFKNQIKAAENL